MTEIQLGSGPSSSATHRLTQSSHTLNRRYVSRPSNLAIEEAVPASPRTQASTAAPSRLVNLRVHAADLVQQVPEPAPEPPTNAPVVAKVVEFGGETTPVEPPSVPIDLTQMVPPEETPEEPISYLPVVSPTPETVAPTSILATESTEAPAPTAEIDTQSLAMSIAADYASASLGATITPPESYNTLPPVNTDGSIDTIARAASEAIAAIRVATDPEEVAEQVTSLQQFAANLKSSSTPEMIELSDTIEKFVSVAMKSSKIQEEVERKAAHKKEQSSVKVSTKLVAKRPAAATVKKPIATAKPISSTRSARASSAKKATPISRPVTRPAMRRAARSTAAKPKLVADEDQALRKALRSVASMEEDAAPRTKASKKRLSKSKTTGKRFALAFFCAAACVAAVVYFVGSNIPDISVKVAAMQTGIEASYPSYIPRDYSLSDISSENGKITLTFKGPERAAFTLTEEKSSWDSTTLLRNYVEPTWQTNYITTHEQGITLYISGSNAAWVNGGVLYKIEASNESLTKKQLRNIVISM